MRIKRHLLLTLISLMLVISGWLYLGVALRYIPAALATGGAFKDTKHGGGTVDGIGCPPRCGVDRSINPEVGIYYFEPNPSDPQGGQYQPGECNHCHEPHASFGGSEPSPVNNTANPYLLMMYGSSVFNYSELCWYCHDYIAGAGGPGTGYWNFYQGNINYQQSSHFLNADGGPTMSWPGGTGGASGVGNATDTIPIWPRRGRSVLPPANNGSCLNCHTPHGIKGSYDATGTPAAATNYLTGATAAATDIIPRQLIAREEALCINCHDSTGPASTDIKTQVDKWGFIDNWSATEGSGHPVRAGSVAYPYFDRHNFAGMDKLASTTNNNEPPVYSVSGGWFTLTSKHAECVDCHNPHAVQGKGGNSGGFWNPPWDGGVFQWSRGSNNSFNVWNNNRNSGPAANEAIRLAAQNRGVWGVNIDPVTGNITGIISSLQSWNDGVPNYVYNLCLKCHSYWAWGAANAGPPTGDATWNTPSTTKVWVNAYPTAAQPRAMTNQTWEFASNRVAYHPVFDRGKNRPEDKNGPGSGVKNPCWCSNALGNTTGYTCPPTATTQIAYPDAGCQPAYGTRTDFNSVVENGINMWQTLSQNFVPPWRHTSRITCTDCHEDSSETSSRGPHGSARPFILRTLDTTISYTLNNTTGGYTYNYSTITNTANFCLNCHRADVYGREASVPAAGRPGSFARQPHYTFDGGNSHKASTGTSSTPNGIICMRCHGGARDYRGSIHGNDARASQVATAQDATPCISPTCIDSGRLIPTTTQNAGSSEWVNWTKSSVGNPGSCTKGTTSPYCANTTSGAFGAGATYDY